MLGETCVSSTAQRNSHGHKQMGSALLPGSTGSGLGIPDHSFGQALTTCARKPPNSETAVTPPDILNQKPDNPTSYITNPTKTKSFRSLCCHYLISQYYNTYTVKQMVAGSCKGISRFLDLSTWHPSRWGLVNLAQASRASTHSILPKLSADLDTQTRAANKPKTRSPKS